jgi:hypothetical protein
VTDLLLPDLSEFQYPPKHAAADLAGIAAMNGGAAIIRAAYGTREDVAFLHFRAAAAAAKFRFLGIYQYLRHDEDPIVQARALHSITGPLLPGEIPVCDLEEGDGDQSNRAAQWLQAADNAYGLDSRPLPARSWLYSYSNFVTTHGLSQLFQSPRRTWIAAYSSIEPMIGHTLWQCTDGKFGPHITDWPGAGKVDTNLYHGTLDELAAIIAPPKPAGPFRHVAAGHHSLAEVAALRGTTEADLAGLTLEHGTPAEQSAMTEYEAHHMPAGLIYYTHNP